MGPSNAGGQQACFLQERLWLLVLSREAKELAWPFTGRWRRPAGAETGETWGWTPARDGGQLFLETLTVH